MRADMLPIISKLKGEEEETEWFLPCVHKVDKYS